MEPLICPQCGGQITNYLPGQAFATCSYCSTRFLIEAHKTTSPPPTVYEPIRSSGPKPQLFVIVLAVVLLVFGGVILMVIVSAQRITSSLPRVPGSTPSYSFPTPKGTPGPTPDPNLLNFGGKGTGNGLFKDANSITVDRQGRIYVSDDSLRVQQFDDKGTYIRSIQVPSKTGNYDHARTIDKIAAGDDGKLYVAVGGVIQVYNENATELSRVIEMAPDYIQDFALKSDGGMDIIYNNDRVETLIVVTKTGKITKQIKGFHTNALDAVVSPQETAIVAIRLAVDGAGNIFSVYAFGDLGSYQISSNNDELMIARFTAEGKYVNKFVQSMNSCGIAVDNQSRIYVSEQNDLIKVYTNNGDLVGTIAGLKSLNAFALDKDNNVYAVLDDRVVKRPAI